MPWSQNIEPVASPIQVVEPESPDPDNFIEAVDPNQVSLPLTPYQELAGTQMFDHHHEGHETPRCYADDMVGTDYNKLMGYVKPEEKQL